MGYDPPRTRDRDGDGIPDGWEVDQAILNETEKLVVIRFGHDWDPQCMQMDEIICKIAYKLSKSVVFYVVDITKVSDKPRLSGSKALIRLCQSCNDISTFTCSICSDLTFRGSEHFYKHCR